MDPIALTGLIIALIALVIALFQLLQQLLATADGFRSCQGPIMGPWAALTERHFLKREFRYETLLSVPYISMGCLPPRRRAVLRRRRGLFEEKDAV